MHYYKSNNEIMQYCSFSNDIALIMHYRALLKRSGVERFGCDFGFQNLLSFKRSSGLLVKVVPTYHLHPFFFDTCA